MRYGDLNMYIKVISAWILLSRAALSIGVARLVLEFWLFKVFSISGQSNIVTALADVCCKE
jgi:hypothetical protein